MALNDSTLLQHPDSKTHPVPTADVSVIIATYKRPHLIIRALDSIAAQTLKPAEILVVDDCSKDHSEQVVDIWSRHQDIPVHFIAMEQNSGVGAARNRAMRQARSSYIAFLDSDDAYLPAALETLLPPLLNHPEAVLSFADAEVIAASGKPEGGLMRRVLSPDKDCVKVSGTGPDLYKSALYKVKDPLSTLLLTSMIPTCSAIFRRDAASKIGFMPEYRFGEDWLFWLKLTGEGDFLCQFVTTSHAHRQSDNLTGLEHSAAFAAIVLHAFLCLRSGDFGVPLKEEHRVRLTHAIEEETKNWRYQNSKAGLRHYIHSLSSPTGQKSGGMFKHLIQDPKSIFRAIVMGWR